jgi:hypothetical protein
MTTPTALYCNAPKVVSRKAAVWCAIHSIHTPKKLLKQWERAGVSVRSAGGGGRTASDKPVEHESTVATRRKEYLCSLLRVDSEDAEDVEAQLLQLARAGGLPVYLEDTDHFDSIREHKEAELHLNENIVDESECKVTDKVAMLRHIMAKVVDSKQFDRNDPDMSNRRTYYTFRKGWGTVTNNNKSV